MGDVQNRGTPKWIKWMVYMENPIKMDDSGRKKKHHLRKHPNIKTHNSKMSISTFPKKRPTGHQANEPSSTNSGTPPRKQAAFEPRKKPLLLSIESWLVNDGPYFMFYEIIPDYNWVGFHPLRKTQPTRLVFFHCSLKKTKSPKKRSETTLPETK